MIAENRQARAIREDDSDGLVVRTVIVPLSGDRDGTIRDRQLAAIVALLRRAAERRTAKKPASQNGP